MPGEESLAVASARLQRCGGGLPHAHAPVASRCGATRCPTWWMRPRP